MFFKKLDNKVKILALGAHPDDIELGCTGFLLRSLREYDAEVHFAIMTYGTRHWKIGETFEAEGRAREALESLKILLGHEHNHQAKDYLHLAGFEDCELSNSGHALIEFLETTIGSINPDIILTHAPEDLHDDHRQTHHATLSAARNFHGSILFYQTPSTIPNNFSPSIFIQFSPDDFQTKLKALGAHISQRDKDFMVNARIVKMSEAWGAFHRMENGTKLEAFKLHQSFWNSIPTA
jgi:LmbE family N-acetylglucosaminyl deacetylase